MASPVDSARQGTNISTAATSHAINVGSPVAGTLLIVLVRFAAAPGTVTFTGYTQFAADTSDATDDDTRLYYRQADGAEGATDTLSTTNSVKLAALSWEVTGAENPATVAPTVSTVAVGTTTANSANPTSVSAPVSNRDILYIAVMGLDGEGNAPTASPSGYSTITTANSGTGGAVATNCSIGGGSLQVGQSASNDAGAFTHAAATTGWTAFTVAIAAAFAFTQEAYRFRNDDGSETAATWRQAINTADTIALDTQFRLRIAIDHAATGSDYAPPTGGFILEYRRKPSGGAFGSWATVSTTDFINPGASSPHYTDSTATTQQISAGTFDAGILREGTALTGSIGTFPAGTDSEFEFLLTASSADGAVADDTYEFRMVIQSGSTAFATYTNTPSLVIATAAAPGPAAAMFKPPARRRASRFLTFR